MPRTTETARIRDARATKSAPAPAPERVHLRRASDLHSYVRSGLAPRLARLR